MTIIKPTIGRRVWYRPNGTNVLAMTVYDSTQPLDAGIVYVWGERMVNLDVTDHAGVHHAITSVNLIQEGDDVPYGAYCEWMPYQKGQATKDAKEVHAAGETKDEKVDAMVSRFLGWKLPADFAPDGGISFSPSVAADNPHWPHGTNLLHAGQAKQMILHLLGD